MGILVGDFGFFHNFDPEILDFFRKNIHPWVEVHARRVTE